MVMTQNLIKRWPLNIHRRASTFGAALRHRIWFEHLSSVRLFHYRELNLLQGRQAFLAALPRVNCKFRLSLIPFLLLATVGHTAALTAPSPHEDRLRFYHTHTGEHWMSSIVEVINTSPKR